MKNIVIYDWPADDNTEFTDSITKASGEYWKSIGIDKIKGSKIKKAIKNLNFIIKIFMKRNSYSKIICWQQIHGLIFACLCRMFHVKKRNELTIMTLIYKDKNGIIGKVWRKFFEYALTSKYVDRIIVFSKFECDFYSKIFNVKREKFTYTTFGVLDEGNQYSISSKLPDEGGYILDVGRSNRDHMFLIEALKGSKYKVIIADSTFEKLSIQNCEIRKDINYGKELNEIIAKAFCVVVPLKDVNVSSGQTVIIQAMMFGKPIIITKNNAIKEYVDDGITGFTINKNEDELIKKIELLSEDSELYKSMSLHARQKFINEFTIEAMGRNVGNIIMS